MEHCNTKDILNLGKVVNGMKVTDKKTEECDVCVQGKVVEERSRIPDPNASQPLELVHCDIAGPIEPAPKEAFRYPLIFADGYSGVTMVHFLKHKSVTLQKILS